MKSLVPALATVESHCLTLLNPHFPSDVSCKVYFYPKPAMIQAGPACLSPCQPCPAHSHPTGSQPVGVTFSDWGSGTQHPPGQPSRSCCITSLLTWEEQGVAGHLHYPQTLPGLRSGPRMAVQGQGNKDHSTSWHWWMGRAPLLLPNCAFLCPHLSPQSPSAPPPLPFGCRCTGCAAHHSPSQQPQVSFRLSAHFCTA